jgi:putative spermidine/putrescine transport system permease protein
MNAWLRQSSRPGRWLLRLCAFGALGFILLPLFFVAWLAFFSQEIPSFPPEGYSFRWFSAVYSEPKFLNGFMLSFQIALLSTLIGLALCIPAAIAINRFRFTGKDSIGGFLLVPLVVPGVVLGTAIYILEVQLEMALDVYAIGSITGLILSHILIVVPWCIRLISASLAGLDRGAEEAAMNLGATPWVAFRRILLPSIRPGIVAASLFGFVVSFGNLEMTLFLVGPGQTTLPIAILQYLEWKIDPTIAAVSVIQILLIGAALIVTDRYVKLSRVV